MTTSRFDLVSFWDVLRAKCVSVWLEKDKLHIWPASRLTHEQVAFIRKHKAEIVAYLCRRNADLLPSDEVCRAWRRRYANTGSSTP